jgi:hypothetical protein
MKNVLVLALILVGCGTAQAGFMDEVDKLVTDGQQIREQVPPAQEEAAPQPRHEAPTVGEDRHYIQSDDFFISEQPMGDQAWIYVTLSKMTQPPNAQTKGEAEFFRIANGASQWTKYFWRTRLARPDEIRLGALMIMFEGRQVVDVYQQPENKESARRDAWFMARITDVSDLYKGYVTVSGGYKVSPKNLRVLVGR